MDSISEKALQKNFVEDVKYDKDLVSLMNGNVKRIGFWILIISGVFALIAMLLINSSIRLMYIKRFSIKTMQMVGATKQFIRRPFVMKYTFGNFGGAFGNRCEWPTHLLFKRFISRTKTHQLPT